MNPSITTEYLGLQLRSPIVISACPLSADVEKLKKYIDAGAAAAVMPSLFEEQIEHDELELYRCYEFTSEVSPEGLDYFPEMEDYNTGSASYLRNLEKVKQSVDIPIIASLNGTSKGGWVHYATKIQETGVDALELNIYYMAADIDTNAQKIEKQYIELVQAVREEISIPLGVKVGPYFSAFANFAKQIVDAGADGLVLFNRFLQPDFNLQTLNVDTHMVLSQRQDLRLRLRWTAILYGTVKASLAVTGGVHESDDILKAMLAGADVVMLASVLYRQDPAHLQTMIQEIQQWLIDNDYDSLSQLKGSMSYQNTSNPAAYERSNYMKTLTTFTSSREV